MQKPARSFQLRTPWILLAIVVVVLLGALGTVAVRHSAESRERQALLTRARIAAAAIGLDDIGALAGTAEDLGNPQYQALKRVVTLIKNGQNDVRFVYLMGYRGGDKLFFYVDSEDPGSPDYSGPGDLYPDTDALQLESFKNGTAFVEGPYHDSWGDWVSGFAPILHPATGQTAALVGIDIHAQVWRADIFRAELVPLLITLLFVSLLLFTAFFTRRTERYIKQIEMVDKMKSEFVSVASHQLRTPLTGIKWFADLLLRGKAGPLSQDQKDFMKNISESNDRMIKLVENLLNVSRIETGKKFMIVKALTEVLPILKSLMDDLVALATAHQVTVVLAPDFPQKLTLSIDPEKMRQVFQNFMTNAVKYSRVGGTVEIGCKLSPEEAVFSIRDTGLGIPAAQQSRVFQKFFRADNVQTAETDGTGLGLYIAKAIIEGHGGRVWFKSEENKGTTFSFFIPLTLST